MDWTRPIDLHLQVQKLWNAGTLLACLAGETLQFPKRLRLKGPSSSDLTRHYAEVRHWMASLQAASYCRLEMQSIRHRVIGENLIPKAVWIDCLDDAFRLIKKQKEADRFSGLLALTRSRNPVLIEWMKKYPLKILAFAEDWSRLLDVIDWMSTNPNPGIYIRQVDIPGIDSKFIEAHRGTLIALLDLILPQGAVDHRYQGAERFALRYGFLEKPSRIRFRVLDPSIALLPGLPQDITVTQESFRLLETDARIRGKIRRVFITENEVNYLAFPALPNSIAVFGAGYGFDFLSNISWLADALVYYWGDIDTHGFAILDQLRIQLPHATSILMDRETLMAHRRFWGKEERQETRDLPRLTEAERQVYDELRYHRLSPQLRLEQERIGFGWVIKTLKHTI